MARGPQHHRFPVHKDKAAVSPLCAKYQFGKFRSPRPQQTGKTNNFTGLKIQTDRFKHAFLAKVLDLNFTFGSGIVAFVLMTVRADFGQFMAEHVIDQINLFEFFGDEGADQLAIAQDRDPVGDGIDLIKEMGNKNNAKPLGLKVAHDAKQAFDFFGIEACGRFIQNQNPRIKGHRTGNRHKLLNGHRIGAQWPVDVDIKTQDFKRGLGVFVGFFPRNQTKFTGLAFQHQVFGHRQCRDQIDFLKNCGNTQRLCVARVVWMDFFAVKCDGTGIARMDPGDHLDQGRFAGPVFTQKCVNFAFVQIKINVLQGLDPGKEFPRPAD